ncbi:reverse transcriptase [Phytophthora palmivora]|uniref:Reverse transcriptase n=1 Tax=Phytophthora palmivora TaxID=4796 RepID=A0A2P4XC69_9STRA|nr:reverse transcriptase [Phytophthora palmivora]
MVEFALNNAVHASTGFTPSYLNGLRHPQVPLTLRGGTLCREQQIEAPLHRTLCGPGLTCRRYHDPLGPSTRTEEGQGESSPARNEAEPSGQPELPVSKPVNGTQVGTHASHTKEWEELG